MSLSTVPETVPELDDFKYTIYTVGDPSTISDALTAMSLFFGQESWVASLLQAGLMISLLLILAKGATRDGLRLDIIFIQMLAIWAAFIPKTTVVVEQFSNEAPAVTVSKVPYAIAIPASLAGAFAYYMTDKIETSVSSVDNYFSVTSGENPFTPAKMLLSFAACPQDPLMCIDQNLAETMRNAARYCSGGDLANVRFERVGNVLEAFANTMTETGQTIVYTSEHPYRSGGGAGEAKSCSDAKDYLLGISNSIKENNFGPFEPAVLGRLNYASINRYKANDRAIETGANVNVDDSLSLINRVADNIGKIDYVALTNVMTYSIAQSLKQNAANPIDQQVFINRDRSLFEWAQNEANDAMLVSASAPEFMDILFFIFIASTPLVMFVVASNPMSGIKVAGSYILFGIWTQSWIPMMAIVMAWYQNEIQKFLPPVGNIMTVEYMANLMRHVVTSTIAAGNMIKNAPYMTFAILAGSMFALSNMISRAMPSSEGSPASNEGGQTLGATTKGGSSSQMANGTLWRMQAAMGGMAALSSGSLGTAPITGDVANELGSSAQTYSFDAGINRGLEAVRQKSSQSMAQSMRSLTQAFNTMFGIESGGGVSTQGGIETSGGTSTIGTDGRNAGVSSKDARGNSATVRTGASSENSLTTSQGIRASLGAILPLFEGAKDKLEEVANNGSTQNERENAARAAADMGTVINEMKANTGDAKAVAATGEKFAKIAAEHDSKAKKDGFKIIDFIKKGFDSFSDASVNLGVVGSFGADASQKDGQSAELGTENKNANETSLNKDRDAGLHTDVKFQNGAFFRQTGEFSRRGSEVLQALTQAQNALQFSRSVTDIESSANKLLASIGAKGGVNLNQADVAQRYGYVATINNGGRNVSLGEAKDEIIQSVAGVFGGNGVALENFQSRMNAEAARLSQNNQLGMNNSQIAAAAALGALGDMMRGDNVAVATQAMAGVARIADMAGMNPGVNSTELAKLGRELNDRIVRTENYADGMLNYVSTEVPSKGEILHDMDGVKQEAKRRMGAGSVMVASGRDDANAYKDKAQLFGDEMMGKYIKEGAIAIGPTGQITPDQADKYMDATNRQGVITTDGSGVNYVQGGSGSGINQMFNDLRDTLSVVPGAGDVLKHFPQEQGGSPSASGWPSSASNQPDVYLGSGPAISGGASTVETRTEAVNGGGLPEIGLNSGGGSSSSPVVVSSQDMNATPSASMKKPNQGVPSSKGDGGSAKPPLPGRT